MVSCDPSDAPTPVIQAVWHHRRPRCGGQATGIGLAILRFVDQRTRVWQGVLFGVLGPFFKAKAVGAAFRSCSALNRCVLMWFRQEHDQESSEKRDSTPSRSADKGKIDRVRASPSGFRPVFFTFFGIVCPVKITKGSLQDRQQPAFHRGSESAFFVKRALRAAEKVKNPAARPTKTATKHPIFGSIPGCFTRRRSRRHVV